MVTALLVVLALLDWWQPSPEQVKAGFATYYDPGVMARVATNRGYIDRPAEYRDWLGREGVVGAVALNRAGDLGRTVWIEGPEGFDGPFLVADCAQLSHYPGRQERERVVEVDWDTAVHWGIAGPVRVWIWFVDPSTLFSDGKVPIPF